MNPKTTKKRQPLTNFTVLVYEEQGGKVTIRARSEKEAESKAEKILFDHGVNGFPDFEATHREYRII